MELRDHNWSCETFYGSRRRDHPPATWTPTWVELHYLFPSLVTCSWISTIFKINSEVMRGTYSIVKCKCEKRLSKKNNNNNKQGKPSKWKCNNVLNSSFQSFLCCLWISEIYRGTHSWKSSARPHKPYFLPDLLAGDGRRRIRYLLEIG